VIRLLVDGERLDPRSATRFRRVLDLRTGILEREVEWETARGHRLRLRTQRLASLEHRHLLAFRYVLHVLRGAPRVVVSSELAAPAAAAASDDPRRGHGLEHALEPVDARTAGTGARLRLRTRDSRLELACGFEHDLGLPAQTEAAGDHAALALSADLKEGDTLQLTKYAAYAAEEATVERTLEVARRCGWQGLVAAQRRRARKFWQRSDVLIEGAPAAQRAVRFNLFQLMQATACAAGHGVPAKGVTGRGYDGHYFWDSEIYLAPFLTHTNPHAAKELLRARCAMLDAARRRAAELGHAGALFPWRTINGEEASAYYAAGTAQYHINADVAYALLHYAAVTGDVAFLRDEAAEVIVETARFWMSLGFHSPRRGGRFCLHGVTGPDEYSAVVDNNAFTNLMAAEHLEAAARLVEWLHLDVPREEAAAWRRAAEQMYVPREGDVVAQDDGFLDRQPWDFESTPPERYPLLLHHHPLEIYRRQVIKQADAVLAAYLLPHRFTAEQVRATFDYYEPLTTGDSTLSAAVQSVVAMAAGRPEAALEHFESAARVDLTDAHGNTADGIHVASCAGTWLALAAGFAGLRDFDGHVRLSPRLPHGWRRLRLRLQVRGQLLELDTTAAGTTYRLLAGTELLVHHHGRPVIVGTEPVHLGGTRDATAPAARAA
jgi:alpha,alpha-trehalose phosphorylase